MARSRLLSSSSRTETDLFSFNIGNKILKPPLSMTVVPTCRGKGCLQNRIHLIFKYKQIWYHILDVVHPLHCRGKYSPLELTSLEKINLINCTYTSSNYKDTTYNPLNIYCIHCYWPATSYCQLLSTQPS